MAQPLYFLSGATKSALIGDNPFAPVINRELLRSVGLEGVFADVDGKSIGAADFNKAGPDGKAGFLFWYSTPSGAIPNITQHKPELQTWHQCNDRLWLGTLNGQEPTAEDLVRKRVIKGYTLTANAGDVAIPILRRCHDDTSNLPSGIHKDPATGRLARPIRREYIHLWEDSADICAWFFSKEDSAPPEPEMERAYDFALRSLSVNYRASEYEQRFLSLFDYEQTMSICACAVDYYTALQLEEAQKKTASSLAEQNTMPGQEVA